MSTIKKKVPLYAQNYQKSFTPTLTRKEQNIFLFRDGNLNKNSHPYREYKLLAYST